MNTKNVIKLLLFSILLKIVYLFYGAVVYKDAPTFSLEGYKRIISRNDTGWYRSIVANGYPEVSTKEELGDCEGWCPQSPWAFFPFYPMIVSGLMNLFNIDFDTSAFFLSLLFSFLSLIGFYRFCEIFLNDSKKAFYFSMVFLLFPFHYYFSMMYTEAVFFTFMIYSFIVINKRKYWILPFLLMPMTLTRPNGIILLIPIYLYYLEIEGILSKKRIDFPKLFNKENILKSLIFLSAPIAFFAYCIYQKQMTGFYFAFSIAQAGWSKEFIFPLLSLFRKSDFISQFNSFYTVAAMLIAVISWKKLPLSFNILIWLSILIPLTSGSVVSIQRYLSIVFPLTMVISQWFYFTKKFKNVILIILFGLQIYVFYFWLVFHEFSF